MSGRRLLALDATLLVLTALLLFMEIGLATEHNWPKMLRIGAAFAGYIATLLLFGARREPLTFWRYVVAGLVAGALSALVRPEMGPGSFVVAQVVLAALLLAPMHWLIVRRLSQHLPDVRRP